MNPDEPMRLLLLGDFSGRAAANRPPLATRPTQRVDIDTVDGVMKRLAPVVTLPAGEIRFTQLDDFHPDRLYARLELFKALRQARADPQAGTGDLFDRLLGKSAGAPAAHVPAPKNPIDALIRDIVAPYIVADTSAQTKPLLMAVDAAITDQMRTVLHAAPFQALEAAWRGVHWLTSSLELDEQLQLHLFDVTREELLADIVGAQGKLAQTGLYRALVARWRNVPGAEGWSCLVGLIDFGPSDADIGLLAALGLIASHAGAPFLAGADLALAGDDQRALAGWNALRRSEAAPSLGLAAPRVLLRLPYGKDTDPVEAFAFEEVAGAPVHDDFLWGTGSLAVALLIGRAFTAGGWNMDLDADREIGELPAFTFVRDGERELQPCAERFLPETALQALLNAGLIPIASRRDRNAVVVIRFQSISDPPAPLTW
jgi:type VI secretion system protein ImpC